MRKRKVFQPYPVYTLSSFQKREKDVNASNTKLNFSIRMVGPRTQ